jgi:hypothetical protein
MQMSEKFPWLYRAVRKQLHHSYEEMGAVIGVDQRFIRYLEAGGRRTSFNKFLHFLALADQALVLRLHHELQLLVKEKVPVMNQPRTRRQV